MKKLIIIASIILLSSCSKSIYYAYTDGSDYYSLEVTPKNEEIYRAKSQNYNNEYIYIYMSFFKNFRNHYIDFYSEKNYTILSFWDIYYLSDGKITRCDVVDKNGGILDVEEDIYIYIKQDSLIPESRDIDLDFTFYKGDFLEGDGSACIKEYNKNFLPPYMLKVDKIDYDKLQVEGIPKRLIKHPRKRKKGYNGR